MKMKKSLFYLLAAVISGCIPSLHPLYTNKDLVFEEKLLGVWAENPGNVWEFRKSCVPNAYDLSITMDKRQSEFKAHLVKIDSMLFLDIFPEEPNLRENDFYKFHLLPVHTFIKVEQIEPMLAIRMMDGDKFGKRIKADPNLIKHEVVEDRVVLTASTSELQEFMRRHANEEGVFAEATELKRFEPNVPAEPNQADPNNNPTKK